MIRQFEGRRWLAWGMSLFIAFDVLLFWGTWNVIGQAAFSLGALGYALGVGLKGWKPWRMAVNRALGDGDSPKWDRNPVALSVGAFLGRPQIRWRAAAITGTAALTPWVITSLAAAVGGRPIGHMTSHSVPPIVMVLFGYSDAIRTGTIAMLWMTREVRLRWSQLRKDHSSSTEQAIYVPDDDSALPESLGDLLEVKGVSKGRALLWFLGSLIAVGALGYLRGCLRRHGGM